MSPGSYIRKMRIFVFILVTILDIRVRAVNIGDRSACEKQSAKCAFQAEGRQEKMNLNTAVVKMTKGSSMIWQEDKSITLMRGIFLVNAHAESKINTLFGSLYLTQGEVLIEVKDSVTQFTNLSSDLKYEPRGEGQQHILPIGYASYFTGITKTGVAEAGFPHPAEIDRLTKNWSSFYKVSEISKFKNSLRVFIKQWNQAVQGVGEWYLDIVQREIASEEAEEARRARLKAARDKENKIFRDMFRQRITHPY